MEFKRKDFSLTSSCIFYLPIFRNKRYKWNHFSGFKGLNFATKQNILTFFFTNPKNIIYNVNKRNLVYVKKAWESGAGVKDIQY